MLHFSALFSKCRFNQLLYYNSFNRSKLKFFFWDPRGGQIPFFINTPSGRPLARVFSYIFNIDMWAAVECTMNF